MSTLHAASLIPLVAFAALLMTAAWTDALHLIIPNRVSIAIAALYPAHVLTYSSIDWITALAIAGGALAAGFVLFALKFVGGGDIKLFSVVALWAGAEYFLPFMLVTSLFGGAIAVAMMVRNWYAGNIGIYTIALQDSDPITTRPMPYGVAIAAGGVFVAISKILGA